MVKRNGNFLKLPENYLFPEVTRRVKRFQQENPDQELLSLSIGDTSEPLSTSTVKGLTYQASQLGTRKGYRGYGAEQGDLHLRAKIASVFYKGKISADEIFISDGAKCDIGRLQLLFDSNTHIGVQDPSYPVYVDTSLLSGKQAVTCLPCHPGNDFFPDIVNLPHLDLMFLCSPNNPTGSVAKKEQLQALVQWAKKERTFLIFDAAYSGFIQNPAFPRSIYEIEGANEVAIEISSFSKLAGFSGVRVGWSVIPKHMTFEDGHSVHKDFTRIVSTFFNGASVISQAGALAALAPDGIQHMREMLSFYMHNAQLIKEALLSKGLKIYGGEHAPYLWVHFGNGTSWDLFQILLEKTGLITTPGSGFGKQGEGFLRFSAFGTRRHIQKALERIEKQWPTHL